LPEIDPFNFLPRVTQPVLMLNGKYDQNYVVDLQQEPFYRLLGTPLEHKEHYLDETSHFVSRSVFSSKFVGWLDRYLGVPGRGSTGLNTPNPATSHPPGG
jgi:hypothetical protein